MRLEEVPELTLPIIKPNRDYFCQYCDKVWTLSAHECSTGVVHDSCELCQFCLTTFYGSAHFNDPLDFTLAAVTADS